MRAAGQLRKGPTWDRQIDSSVTAGVLEIHEILPFAQIFCICAISTRLLLVGSCNKFDNFYRHRFLARQTAKISKGAKTDDLKRAAKL